MMRQCLEAHHIETLGKTCAILNRRGEWGQNLPPKLVLEGDNIPEIGKNRKRARKKEGDQSKRQRLSKDDTSSLQNPEGPGTERLMGMLGLRRKLPQRLWGEKSCRKKLKELSQGERGEINLHVIQRGRQ